MSKYTGAAPKWLEDILDKIEAPEGALLTDPEDTASVLCNLNLDGCKFDHADGDVRMAQYVPCADPETGDGVGLVVIFLGDDTRLYHRAKSVQGVDLEDAAKELLATYVDTFNRPSAKP